MEKELKEIYLYNKTLWKGERTGDEWNLQRLSNPEERLLLKGRHVEDFLTRIDTSDEKCWKLDATDPVVCALRYDAKVHRSPLFYFRGEFFLADGIDSGDQMLKVRVVFSPYGYVWCRRDHFLSTFVPVIEEDDRLLIRFD